MPRAFGRDLPPRERLQSGCPPGHRQVTHHDHMYDRMHQLVLDTLSPLSPDQACRRVNFGAGFAGFLRESGKAAMEAVEQYQLRPGVPLLRFPSTTLCERLNPVDGNGKALAAPSHPDADELFYWSMTPTELEEVKGGRRSWQEVFDSDRDLRLERREHARRLAARLVADHLSRK